MRTKWWVPFAFLAPALLGLFLFRVVPILLSVGGGFTGTDLTGETSFQGFDNYTGLLDDPEFWTSVRVTLVFNLIINPLQVVLAFVLALLMAKPGRGVGALRTAVLLPITVSIALTSVMWNLLLDLAAGASQLELGSHSADSVSSKDAHPRKMCRASQSAAPSSSL